MKLKNPFQSATDRLISEEMERKLYEKAALEIENNNIDKGLWVKALSKAEGDEVKQKGIYIELIVERYKDELRVTEKQTKILETELKSKREEQEKEQLSRDQAKQWKRFRKKSPKTIAFAVLLNLLAFAYVMEQAEFAVAVFVSCISGFLTYLVLVFIMVFQDDF
jgi:hypothetical protein